jgi:hypothetical protein
VRTTRGYVVRGCAAVGLTVLVWGFGAPMAEGAKAHAPAANNAPSAKSSPAKGAARAPSKPPLGTGTGGTTLSPEEEGSASVSESGGDPLVDNGLGSPLCREGAEAELSPTGASACRISHFDAAQAPTGNYGFDVHINTGVADVANDVDAEVLNGVQWSWTLLVAVVHGVIVMLEWCYSLDLLNSSKINGITQRLRETQATFTQPWLELALAVAAMFALYHGIVRRRVSQTLGETALMAVMMLGGLWVIVNPLGTIGALDMWANEASLGTLSAVTSGTPEHSGRKLEESMRSIFSGSIGGPWCYMEFGNVRWCEAPVGSDRRLHTTALEIAAKEQASIGSQSAELLRGARKNGELFLALPANGQARNGINAFGPEESQDGLFNVLCGSSKEPCHGPTASEADFRTGGGTLWRIGGLCLFWIGVLGMLLMLGFIGIRLLTAALFSLFFLLLAPAAVIAPAFGDGGRGAFRMWVTRLLGAVCSKLLYSFLLGVVLLMQRTLMSAASFGWAAQWALVSTMWWWLFIKRGEIASFVHRSSGHDHEYRSLLRRARERAQNPPEIVRAGKWVKDKRKTPPPSVGQKQKLAQAGRTQAKDLVDGQVGRMLENEYAEAHALVQAAPEALAQISAKRTQLARMQAAHRDAQAKEQTAKEAGELAYSDFTLFQPPQERDRAAARYRAEERSHQQHAARLQSRMGSLQSEIDGEQSALTAARHTVKNTEESKRERAQAYRGFIEAQAVLPSRGRAGPGGEKRDYAGLAGMVGYGRREFEALDQHRQREARLQIDRELAAHKGAHVAAREVAAVGEGSLKPRERKKTGKLFEDSLEQHVKAEGHELPASLDPRSQRPKSDAPTRGRRDGGSTDTPTRSRVMHDAHEVKAGRKRQLGRERR